MARPLRANVGLKRIASSTRGSISVNTRQIRAQMRKIERRMAKIVDAIEGATPEALLYALQPIFDESQKLVPRDTEALADSGYLEVQEKAGGVVAEVGYGKGGDPYYSVFVHEQLESIHKSPTQAKFLQAALEKNIDKIAGRVRDFLAREIK
ncbi:MAG: hypothetical protein ACC656_01130 [Candidatus Heimdallarchaeota archaeon]